MSFFDHRQAAGTKGGARRTYAVSVTSGKGGVGKTMTTVSLAAQARRMGLSVVVLDGDLGLANVDVVLGLTPRFTISDVIDGTATLKDVILQTPMGFDVIPSGSGVSALADLKPLQKMAIAEQLATIDGLYDLMIVDTGAGIGDTVISLNLSADRTLVVTTPEPHATCDAYGLIKVLAEEHGRKSFDLVVNQTRADGEGLKVYERIAEVAMRFLKARVSYAGSVPLDPQVTRSVMARRAAHEQSINTISGQAWAQMARVLFDGVGAKTRTPSQPQDGEFLRQYLWTLDDVKARARA